MPTLLLVVPASGAECFEPANFGLHVVGLEIEVHPLLMRLHTSLDAMREALDKIDWEIG
jgi:hypothetical protein